MHIILICLFLVVNNANLVASDNETKKQPEPTAQPLLSASEFIERFKALRIEHDNEIKALRIEHDNTFNEFFLNATGRSFNKSLLPATQDSDAPALTSVRRRRVTPAQNNPKRATD